MSQGRDAGIRISGTERDEAVALLGRHMSTGRLEIEEYEFRCVRAVAARTRGDIEALFTDLPAPHPDLSAAVGPRDRLKHAVGLPNDKGLVATPRSAAVGMFCALMMVLGIPGAILLTVFLGMWWTIVAAVGLTIVAGAAEEAFKARP
ncbi:DUF1707 domain-containing protein [Actinokineospora sp. NBRC 105648]|uniref:DUF1707 SHOCT-like domain-containing protein n=1 Tax=Actinokineospora sp. NBRC 105648 TaxID=3032206 RepID=UPI0024A318A9|nr:DUF1707 domain-containing protein [Actinokineospora sp. NBRC 105648]GLZ38558.1 hypothetical protein Acsp05_21820 [Actinokineospora sp. NBRC 105648]